ncbi:hypothetical protein C2S51_015833 [Perilla frutescens var. frutescens]|nr:hypothetical protein C2S51_015833 [Perilla frutescens var. frutescens]
MAECGPWWKMLMLGILFHEGGYTFQMLMHFISLIPRVRRAYGWREGWSVSLVWTCLNRSAWTSVGRRWRPVDHISLLEVLDIQLMVPLADELLRPYFQSSEGESVLGVRYVAPRAPSKKKLLTNVACRVIPRTCTRSSDVVGPSRPLRKQGVGKRTSDEDRLSDPRVSPPRASRPKHLRRTEEKSSREPEMRMPGGRECTGCEGCRTSSTPRGPTPHPPPLPRQATTPRTRGGRGRGRGRGRRGGSSVGQSSAARSSAGDLTGSCAAVCPSWGVRPLSVTLDLLERQDREKYVTGYVAFRQSQTHDNVFLITNNTTTHQSLFDRVEDYSREIDAEIIDNFILETSLKGAWERLHPDDIECRYPYGDDRYLWWFLPDGMKDIIKGLGGVFEGPWTRAEHMDDPNDIEVAETRDRELVPLLHLLPRLMHEAGFWSGRTRPASHCYVMRLDKSIPDQFVQFDGVSCGVYAMMYVDRLLSGLPDLAVSKDDIWRYHYSVAVRIYSLSYSRRPQFHGGR